MFASTRLLKVANFAIIIAWFMIPQHSVTVKPDGTMQNIGMAYLSYILQILFSPLPFLRLNLVVEAWAKIFPPIGFFGSTVNLIYIRKVS